MEAFWEGFEKRSVDWTKVTQPLKNAWGAAKAAVPSVKANMAGVGKQVAADVTKAGKSMKHHTVKGLLKGLEGYASEVGGATAKTVHEHIAHGVKNIPHPSDLWKYLQEVGDSVGAFKKPKGILERAGDAVKAHPYVSAGVGAAGLGGAGYALGSSGGKKPQASGGDYQYYNPYY
jgi:hypothetical protein